MRGLLEEITPRWGHGNITMQRDFWALAWIDWSFVDGTYPICEVRRMWRRIWGESRGWFTFHLLRCDRCGKTKSIGFDKLGELHLRYLKGLEIPYSSVTWEFDKSVQQHYPCEPISEAEYHKENEKLQRKCRCGGRYLFEAPPQCPKCRSTNIDIDEAAGGILYDWERLSGSSTGPKRFGTACGLARE